MSNLVPPIPRKQRVLEVLCYLVFYLLSFALLEQRSVPCILLNSTLDEKIPFCAYFILPYLLWFLYMGACIVWFALFCPSEGDYFRFSRSMAFGCTLFLLISLVFPNSHTLRPDLSAGQGFFCRLVGLLYRIDTPTNVFPSIHVYNSLVCCQAVFHQKTLRERHGMRAINLLLTISIIASTLLLKQHTLLDVMGAFALWKVSSRLFYARKVICPRKYPYLLRRQVIPLNSKAH